MIVDAHCYIGEGFYKKLTATELIALMDDNDVERAFVSPVEEYITVCNREGNDYILKAVKEFPDRLIGFATVNPWYRDGAVEELRRALGEGLKALKLNSALQGFPINDELVYPVIEVAREVDIPVYVHTATPVFALPLQLADLASEFPQVNFIMGHMGATDFWIDVMPAAEMCPNIYLETSLRSPGVLTIAIERVGAGRLVYGSDVPESCMKLELGKINRLALAPDEKERVLGGTALELLQGANHDH